MHLSPSPHDRVSRAAVGRMYHACASDKLHWATRNRAQVLLMPIGLHSVRNGRYRLNQTEVARHPAKIHLGLKANCDSESWDKVPAPTPWWGLVALAVPWGNHGSGCPPNHACPHVDASHVTLSSARACAESMATPCIRGCVTLPQGLSCRNSFPEMHVRRSALVTFRNVPLPRTK